MNPIIQSFGRRLRLGVVGGGPGSFIGPVHRAAARLDDAYEIVAGVLSSNAERSQAAAAALGIPRAYGSWQDLLERESGREDPIDVLAVMTPNDSHVPISIGALDAGLDVICDKPLATSLDEALTLLPKVEASGRVFCLTHNYSAHPMVREARAMVQDGVIGEIRQVQLEYVQPQRATLIEQEEKRGDWHFDPRRIGPSLVLGDIGSHAQHLGSFVAGLEVREVMAEVGATVPGRTSDDTAHLLLRYQNGARGGMWVTQAAAGAEHGLSFRIFGSLGGLEWHHEQPNHLLHRRHGDHPVLMTRRIDGVLSAAGTRAARTEIGHPEGYLEAFATLYREVAEVVVARRLGQPVDPDT
ncbi:MAG: Gfo/Idh/MocA family oxidoreductase, partial [Geminicoccaceae bacterium]|nr:Gfo/Idh/MocA family oxidoreductase [Geminicoccaceae bacterium]